MNARSRIHLRPGLTTTLVVGILFVLFGSGQVSAQVTWGGQQEENEPKRKSCPPGKTRSEDTAGQCCWEGQAWNGARCVGTPTSCPKGLQPDAAQQACAIPGCLAEMVLTPDGKNCCWPGQAWSKGRKACIGKPECGEGYVLEEGGCKYVPPDSDGDGVIDATDACPQVAEDRDGFEDVDGCPDDDNDRDGLADVADQCPDEPEDRDDFQDGDGCPDEDNDKDGVLDTADGCPLLAEDSDGFEDADGCPDEDNDRDGLADASDQCPDQAEDLNGYRDADGCPDSEELAAASQRSNLLIGGWTTLSLGVVGTVGGVAMHMWAESLRDEVREGELNTNGAIASLSQRDAKDREEQANSVDTGAAIAIGAGGALLVAGGTMLWYGYGTEEVDTQVSFVFDGETGLLGLTTRW